MSLFEKLFGNSSQKVEQSHQEEQENRVSPDPFKLLEEVDIAERQKYPEAIRNIRMADVRKKAREKHAEIYKSAKSFDEEKELIDIAVKLFSSDELFAKAPSYVVKAALKLTGYDEDLVKPLYEMLYEEVTRVYNILP